MGRASNRKKLKRSNTKTNPRGTVIKKSILKSFMTLIFSRRGVFLSFIMFIGGVISTYYTYSPKLDISPGESFGYQDPLSSPFIIKNIGLLPVHDIDILCGVNNVKTQGGGGMEALSLGYSKPPIPTLLPDEATTFMPPPIFKFNGNIESGDIEINVSYRPSFIPIRVERAHRFITGAHADGSLHWYPAALSQ